MLTLLRQQMNGKRGWRARHRLGTSFKAARFFTKHSKQTTSFRSAFKRPMHVAKTWQLSDEYAWLGIKISTTATSHTSISAS